MSGKESNDTASLKGLFSTRDQRNRAPTSVEQKDAGSTKGGSQANSPSASGSRADTSGGAPTKPRQSNSGSTITQGPEMSPLAAVVMREARREIGSDSAMQQQLASGSKTEMVIAYAVDRVLKKQSDKLDDLERANVIITLQKDLVGWGVLQPLIDNREVTDIHVYDYKTVVLQRGKVSETTGLSWPTHQAYTTFIDRLLLR